MSPADAGLRAEVPRLRGSVVVLHFNYFDLAPTALLIGLVVFVSRAGLDLAMIVRNLLQHQLGLVEALHKAVGTRHHLLRLEEISYDMVLVVAHHNQIYVQQDRILRTLDCDVEAHNLKLNRQIFAKIAWKSVVSLL